MVAQNKYAFYNDYLTNRLSKGDLNDFYKNSNFSLLCCRMVPGVETKQYNSLKYTNDCVCCFLNS